ncbi:MAG: universal stress protein [Bacteroidia bacterium]|nr:MAG: universal stress protein [Bacteroidia bacterium]
MKSPKNILVPIDMSVLSITGLQYAEDIAEHFGSTITVLYVAGPDELSEQEHGPAKEAEAKIKQAIAHLLLDHNVVTTSLKIEIRRGSPAQEIVKASRELHSDLIVMCTHGRSGLSHMLMGSVAEKVVRTALCPVLTIKPDEFSELVNVTDEDITNGLHLE